MRVRRVIRRSWNRSSARTTSVGGAPSGKLRLDRRDPAAEERRRRRPLSSSSLPKSSSPRSKYRKPAARALRRAPVADLELAVERPWTSSRTRARSSPPVSALDAVPATLIAGASFEPRIAGQSVRPQAQVARAHEREGWRSSIVDCESGAWPPAPASAPAAGRLRSAGSRATGLDLLDVHGHLSLRLRSMRMRRSRRRRRSALRRGTATATRPRARPPSRAPVRSPAPAGRGPAALPRASARGFSMPLAGGDRLPVVALARPHPRGPGRFEPASACASGLVPGVVPGLPAAPPPAPAPVSSEGELDLLLRQRQRQRRAQRLALGGEELERLLQRVHEAVELERPPHEAHRRRHELVLLAGLRAPA